MAKLSEQIAQKSGSQQPVSRTQRVAQRQSVEREQQKFENLKARAKAVQEQEFSKVTSVDEYEQKYNALDTNLKQFFQTPSQMRQDQTQRISTAKLSVQDKIKEIELERTKEKAYYKKKEDYYWDKYKEYKRKGDDKRAERYKERSQKYEDRGDEKDDELRGQIKGLNKGLKELQANKDVSYKNIWSYAREVGDYEEARERAKNEGKALQEKYSGELQGLSEAESWQDYAKRYAKLPDRLQDMISLKPASKKARGIFERREQEVALSKQGLKPIFKGGEVAGYEDAVLGMSYSAEAFESTFKQKRTDLGIKYDAKTGSISIGKTPAQQYQEWIKERPTKAFYSDPTPTPSAYTIGGRTYAPQTDFVGYVDQGTISTEPKYIEIPSDIDYKKPSISAGFDWLGEQYRKIPTGKWTFNIGGLTGIGLSPYKDPTAIKTFDFTEKIGQARDFLSGKTSDVNKALQDLETVEPKLQAIDERYQAQGQARFEDLYAKEIIYGEITPEKAQAEFEKSKSFDIWQKQYAEEYGETFKGAIARENIGYGSAFKYGSKKFAYNIGDFVLGRIETPKATAETGAVVGGIVLTYGQLSPAVASAVGWGLTGATGVYGAVKTFDPKSTPSEVFGGSVMLATATATAGYGAYKYLKAPVVKTVKIKAPKSTLKASQTKGYDVKYITESGKLNKVVYPKQKLSQTGVAGRRTTVTTKWRTLSNKYLKTNLKNIYEGIPTQQLPKTYTATGLRGSYKYTAGKSGYQQAKDLLKKYGYSEYQATSTLRYTAPRVYEQYLKSGEIIVKGSKAVGGFTFETTRPVVSVDKSLGIKTRGGGATTDYTMVQRQLLQTKGGQRFILEKQLTNTYGINLKGIKSFKQVQEKWNLGVSKASDTKSGLDVIRLNKELSLYEKITYKDVVSGSKTFLKGTGTISKDLVKFNLETMPTDASVSKTILIDKVKDLTKGTTGIRFTGGQKTPLSKTFGVSDNVDDILNQIGKTKPIAQSKDVAKVINQLEDIRVTSPTPTPSQSQFYGKGVYERSAGGVSPQQMQILQNELKTIAIPDVKINALKDILQFKPSVDIAGITAKAGLTALGLSVGLKSQQQLKTDLKASTDLKNLIKTDVAVKSATTQDLAIKTTPALKTQLKSLLDLSSPVIDLATPTFRPPSISTPTPPIPKAIVFPFLKDKISKKAGKRSKQVSDYAYLPDFTSRALGLKVETVSEKQAKKKLKQILTGLEIRRGVKIK